MARRLRVFCSDPDATDSSSDEECERLVRRSPMKKVVVEICLPNKYPRSSSAPEGLSKGKISSPRRPTSPSAPRGRSGIKGIRLRKWGKWAAEIRDPIRHKRVWIGTYATAADAEMAYRREQLKFEAEKEAMTSAASLAIANTTTATFSSSSTPTTSVSDESDTPRPFAVSSPSSVLDAANAKNTLLSKPESAPARLPSTMDLMMEDFSAIPFDQGPLLPQDIFVSDFGIDVDSFFSEDLDSMIGNMPLFDNLPLLDGNVHDGGVCSYSPLDNAFGFDGFFVDGRGELSDSDLDPSLWMNS